ncbi:MAG: helix-turn-helix domain-containing protein [Candidatus Omnitrophica bacterium]|nr:helix-turn-helix domain-containing protein [Candidatus Omnitrophota bacterium]
MITGEEDFLSIPQVAKRFGVNNTTIYRMAQRGALPGFKIGSQWRFSRRLLDSWVADQVTMEWLKAEDKGRKEVL